MTDTPPVPTPATATPADPNARAGRRIPIGVWIAAGGLVVVLVIVIAVLAAQAFGGGSPTPEPSASSPSPSPSASPSPSPTPSEEPEPEAGGFDADMTEIIASILDSQNTAVLAQNPFFSDPVQVVAANSGQAGPLSPDDAVAGMDFMFTLGDPVPWDLALPESTLAQYRSGPFGEFFPEGAIVARSNDCHVFSFIGHDRVITTMFLAGAEELILP